MNYFSSCANSGSVPVEPARLEHECAHLGSLEVPLVDQAARTFLPFVSLVRQGSTRYITHSVQRSAVRVSLIGHPISNSDIVYADKIILFPIKDNRH